MWRYGGDRPKFDSWPARSMRQVGLLDEAAGDLAAQRQIVPVEYCTGAHGTANRRLRRRVRGLLLWGRPVTLDRTPDQA